MRWLHKTKDGCILTIKAVPRASISEIAGAEEEWLRVRLKAPPVDNKANSELVRLLSAVFDVPRRAVTLVSGGTGRLKRVHLRGVSEKRIGSLVKPRN